MSSLAGLLIAFPDQIDIETVADALPSCRFGLGAPLRSITCEQIRHRASRRNPPQLAHDWSRKKRPNIV
jgi:hypothetical protein